MRLCKIISKSRNRECYARCNNETDNNKCFEKNILKTLENKYTGKQRSKVPLRVFAKKVENIIYVCLIDLHHLAIPVPYHKSPKSNYKEIYDKKSKFKYCISSVNSEVKKSY